MPGHKQGQNSRPGGLPQGVLTFVDGVGYSLEVLLHEDIGERRVRDMGGPLFVAVGILTLLSLFVRGTAQFTTVSPGEARGQVQDGYYAPNWQGYYPERSPERKADRPVAFDPIPFFPLIFCLFVVGAHLRQRVRAWRRRHKGGPPTQSYYTGRPDALKRLGRFFPGLTELTCKRWIEPVELFFCGSIMLLFHPLLGLYLMLAGGVLCLTVNARLHQERELVLDTNDGMIDMLAHQDRVRAESNPQPERPVSAHASMAVPQPAVQTSPAAERRQERPLPRPEPVPLAVPPALCDGLNENLMHLLQENHHEE